MATSWVVAATLALAALESLGSAQTAPPTAERRALPAPQGRGPALSTVLRDRHSSRAFARRELDDRQLGELLWAAQGLTAGAHRTAPSAGALYPITVRVADARGVWRYVPADHAVVREVATDRRGALAAASFGQDAVGAAPATLVIAARFAITARKYGGRAERFATLEAGHVAQNVLLEATALGLGAVPVGAFDDAAVRRAAGLAPDETPLYLIPVGSPP